MPITNIKTHSEAGFTLIEVLVAAIVLAIGILGLATTMLTGLKSDKSAYYRSQASAIAYDMADRMRLNQDAIASYINLDTNNNAPSAPGCLSVANGCNAADQYSVDVREWKNNFANVTNVSAFSPKLPNGRGQVTQDAAGRYVITVSWSEDDWTNNAGAIARNATTESLSVTFLSL